MVGLVKLLCCTLVRTPKPPKPLRHMDSASNSSLSDNGGSDDELPDVEAALPYDMDTASDCGSERSQPPPPTLPRPPPQPPPTVTTVATMASSMARRASAPAVVSPLTPVTELPEPPCYYSGGNATSSSSSSSSSSRGGEPPEAPELYSLFQELEACERSGDISRRTRALVQLKRVILAHVDFRRHRLVRQAAALTRRASRLRGCTDCAQMVVVSAALGCLAIQGAATTALMLDTIGHSGAAAAPAVLLTTQVLVLACLRFHNVQHATDEALAMRIDATSILQSLNEYREQLGRVGRYADVSSLWVEIERRCQAAMAFSSRYDVRYGSTTANAPSRTVRRLPRM